MNIVTGASENHYKSLKQFLNSCNNSYINTIFVYDLGLTGDSLDELKSKYNIIIKHFDFSKYPSYFDISVNAGEYAWKPVIIYETMKEVSGILLWCDAGNILPNDLTNIITTIKNNNIYSPTSSGTIEQWTHPKTLEWFNVSNYVFTNICGRNGAILGFNIDNVNVRDFIQQFRDCACIKECIAPEGSSRLNHRQDQAVFTILYYIFFKNSNTYIDDYCGIRIHQDID